MTSKSRMTLEGVDRFRRTLDTAADTLDDLSDAHSAAAGIVAGAVASRAPRRSGQLAASVSATTETGRALVNIDAPYAGPIHWGWSARNIPANRFATDAARATEATWIREYEQATARALSKVKGV